MPETLTKDPVAQAVNTAIVEQKLEKIRQSTQIHELMVREQELIDRINKLSAMPDTTDSIRQKAMMETDLLSVRSDRVRYQEDIGVLAVELFSLYDELGMQTTKAGEDSPEDIAIRQKAKDAEARQISAIATANAGLESAQTEKTSAKDAWWPFGKADNIRIAQRKISRAESDISNAEKALEGATEEILLTEDQIEINKRERIRKASLAENFALIRQFTSAATNILTQDIEATEERASLTEKALASALKKKRETARELDAVRDSIRKGETDLRREENALDEISDQGGSEYAEQQTIVTNIETEMSALKGSEIKFNTTHQAMTQAIEANKSSLMGLQMQAETAGVYFIKLTNAEKTAEILGANIDRMVKNTQQEVASDALDRVSDSMIQKAHELGIKAEIASVKNRNDAVERHDKLMATLTANRASGDQAVAVEAQRYIALDTKIRQGYKDRGVDLEMSHLESALSSLNAKHEQESATSEVTY